jgi:hypothetical protein
MPDATSCDSAGCGARQRRCAVALLAAGVAALLLTACGSSSKAALTNAQVRRQTCKRVEAVLSDGPEPQADPIGYAQAQILPLREIHTTDAKLTSAIGTLASAYRRFTVSDGASSAKAAVDAATKAIAIECPGIEL